MTTAEQVDGTLHRLVAIKSLGRLKIPCRVVQIDARTARLWELAENLHRVELTALQRSEQIDEWIQLTADQLVEQPKGDVSAQSDPKPQGGRPEGGIRAASRALGVDRSKARRARKRVAGIPSEIRDKIRTMQGVKGVDLDALASAPPERQSAALDAVESGEAKNVREALARLEGDGLEASSSHTGPQPDLPFSEPPAPTQGAVKDPQGEGSKAMTPQPISRQKRAQRAGDKNDY